MNLRLSYARAINRPSFFEIVPYSIINEEYKEKGNPTLKHTIADNIDLRWEYFPKSSEQFMVGFFYKHLQNPIEYGLINEGQDTYYMPMNMGNANNLGVEVDILKYFNKFGIKANYTFTHSQITTEKRTMQNNEIITVSDLSTDKPRMWQIYLCYTKIPNTDGMHNSPAAISVDAWQISAIGMKTTFGRTTISEWKYRRKNRLNAAFQYF